MLLSPHFYYYFYYYCYKQCSEAAKEIFQQKMCNERPIRIVYKVLIQHLAHSAHYSNNNRVIAQKGQ